MRRLLIAITTVLTISTFSVESLAAEKPSIDLIYQNIFIGRLNPLGLKNDFNLMLSRVIVDEDHILFTDSHAEAGLVTSFAPTATKLGFGVVVQPVAVLKMYASVRWVGHYTPFNNMLSFDSPRAEYSDTDRDELGEANENYPTQGVYFTLGALVQAKFWQIVVRNDFKAVYADLDLKRGDTCFYDIEWDVLVPDAGWVLFNNTDLLWMSEFGLLAGARYSLLHASYDDDMYLAGESTNNPNTPIHKIGPVLGWKFEDVNEGFQKPTLLLLSQWHLKHRWRTGEDVHQGVPSVILALSFVGSLIP